MTRANIAFFMIVFSLLGVLFGLFGLALNGPTYLRGVAMGVNITLAAIWIVKFIEYRRLS